MAKKNNGLIRSRPNAQKNLRSDTTGLRQMGLETKRDGFLYVPKSFLLNKQAPLLVVFHGAEGTARQAVESMKTLADQTGTILVVPQSQGKTWDYFLEDFGQDIELLDEALSDAFALYPVDSSKIAIGGFAEGASYALSLGLKNGDLFSHILAFSPGLIDVETAPASPRVFISHGISDDVFSIDKCSRLLVPKLKKSGLEVTYEEFNGGHAISPAVGRKAFTWFLGDHPLATT